MNKSQSMRKRIQILSESMKRIIPKLVVILFPTRWRIIVNLIL